MASPQKENGFAPISKELLRAIARARLSPAERACVDCVIDATYGWDRGTAAIGHRDFCNYTGYSPSAIRLALRNLRGRFILEADHGRRPVHWRLQKDYERWVGNGQAIDRISANTSDRISANTSEPHYKKRKASTDLRSAGVAANAIVEVVMELGLNGIRPHDWARQHKSALQLVKEGITAERARELCGVMRQKFPWNRGETFDVFDLRRYSTKAIAALEGKRDAGPTRICGDKMLGCAGRFPEAQMIRGELAWWCPRCAKQYNVRGTGRTAPVVEPQPKGGDSSLGSIASSLLDR